jgi:nucleoside-diphosphate-sugar epimerase
MNILITGGGGYIGSMLVGQLLKKGHCIKCVDRFFFGMDILKEFKKNSHLELIKNDIRDLQLDNFLGVDVVMDLAALSNDPAGDLDPSITTEINHEGRARVAKLAREAGVRKYILSSSCSVYGDTGGEMANEEFGVNPLTVYAKANYAAEQASLSLASNNFSVTILRLATVFGLSARMRFDLVINLMTLNAIETGKINILGGGNQWRPLVHVQDVADAFINVAEAENVKVSSQIFNVGSNRQNYTIRALAYIVRESLPFNVQIVDTAADIDKRNYRIDFDKIARVLKFDCRYSPSYAVNEIYDAIKMNLIDVGIRTRTVEWYKYLIAAKKIVNEVECNGRILS